MVTNLIDHDNLESRTPGSQDDNPKVTLPMVDVVHQLPPVTAPVERKTGGHHDRQTWANQFMPAVGHGTFKVLPLLAEYANPKGQCWPSMELLRHRSGMSDRALRRAFSDLRGKGIVGAGQPGLAVWLTNPYQLSGGLDGWTCAESGIGPVPKVAQVPVPKVAHITRDSSSNPIINPGYPGVVDAKREPDEVTDGGFKSSSFEEEGVTGDRVTGDRVTVRTGLPRTGLPRTGLPRTGLPRTGLPRTGLPGTGLPGTGLPGTGLPTGTGRVTGDRVTGDRGLPGTGLPGTGLPRTGLLRTGLPRTGLPRTGLPRTGPRAGLPRAGLPRAGLPRAGLPRAGLPRAGLPRASLRSRTFRSGLTVTSRRLHYHLRFSKWVSTAGRPGRSTGTWTLPARLWAGPKPRPAGGSFGKTWLCTSEKWACLSRSKPTLRTRPRGSGNGWLWTSAYQQGLSVGSM